MSINSLMTNDGDDIYYRASFRQTLEAHMPHLRASKSTEKNNVPENLGAIFESDLSGYLNEFGYEMHLHWIIMRMSGLNSPHEFGVKTEYLLIPNKRELSRILQAYNTSNRIRI